MALGGGGLRRTTLDTHGGEESKKKRQHRGGTRWRDIPWVEGVQGLEVWEAWCRGWLEQREMVLRMVRRETVRAMLGRDMRRGTDGRWRREDG